MEQTKRFWMVWKDGANAPTKKHETRVAALVEANRLSTANPSFVFYVLVAEYEVEAVVPQIRTRYLPE